MSGSFHIEVILAATYAVFLIAVAGCLELAARHSHRRSERMRVAGFRYDPNQDLWTCPNNQKLLRSEANYESKVVIYRASAHTCNNCAMKTRCTDSDKGRSIEHAADSWLQSEMRRFHRGISLALFGLATVILVAELFRYQDRFERVLLAAMASTILATGVRLFSAFTRGVPKA
jgi:hypothetical protein